MGVSAPRVDIFFPVFITDIGDVMMGLYRTHQYAKMSFEIKKYRSK